MNMTKPAALRLLRLRDSEETTIDGVVWLRLGDEFKASPHGGDGDFDFECWFVDRDEVREFSRQGGVL